MKGFNKTPLFACVALLASCATQPFVDQISNQKSAPGDQFQSAIDKSQRESKYAFTDEFILSVKRGDITTVKQFVSKSAPINLLDANGVHLAIHAVQSNNPALVDYLTSKGMDLNGYGTATYTPIFLAVSKSPAMIDVFIKHKADLDIVSKNSSSYVPAISWGIQKRHSGNVIKLIKADADVNALDSFGVPPILYAFNQQDITVIKLIFAQGGNPDYVDSNGNSLVSAAIQMGNLKLLEVLAEANADLTTKDRTGKTPLSHAITLGNSRIVEFLKKQLGIT